MNAIISWLISFNQSSFLHNYSLIGKVRTWPLTVTRLSENQWQLVEMQRSFSLPNYQHARVSATLASAREPRQRNPMMMMIMMKIIIFYQFHSPVNQTGFSNWWWRSKLPELFPNAIHKEFLPLPPNQFLSWFIDFGNLSKSTGFSRVRKRNIPPGWDDRFKSLNRSVFAETGSR